ncbi:TetR family transcriptional regulator [Microbulbifer sp. THAF38]|uniref:TetR family transcriptional regulator n=1 Tax=Microbulbifer sp. THAF38 TaxID=2587856 RepID=UPI0012696111|nr:TetR family transcriptional regulator [Microbulbifer sp. THAF38]QFT54925.1 HTH-type transcriptional regulator TtgR [Microbulbifer sp. THAF38]
MAKYREEQILNTRERILDAAIRVFHESGVTHASLTAVAELAGVTRDSLHSHFRDRVGLLNALTERMRLPGEDLCAAAGDELKRDPLGTLRTRWIWLFDEIACNDEWQRLLEIIFLPCDPISEVCESTHRIKQGRTERLERMGELLEIALSAGQLPADLDLKLAQQMLHGGLFGVLEDWLLSPRFVDLGDLGEHYFDALLDMIRFSPELRLNRQQARTLH